MITISLCMIVKDEEQTLARCLDSIKDVVDEIIIVDTGSKDKTKNIARKYTPFVYDFKWVDDFSKARNYSFSKASMQYIMWLDADDVLEKKEIKALNDLKSTLDNSVDIVMFKYNLNYLGNSSVCFYRERLLKRVKNYKWVSPIHEVIIPHGNVQYVNITISHKKIKTTDPKRNLKIFNKMIASGVSLDARQTFYYARELYYAKDYLKAITTFEAFLVMKDAWKENKISTCLDLYNIYTEMDDTKNALYSLFRTFEYDTPRAEPCCKIGKHFLDNNQMHTAIFWFKQALKDSFDISSGGFYNKDFYDFIPYLNLCVCYYKLGDTQKAIHYNNKAGKIYPDNPSFLYNVEFFNKKM